MSDPERLLDQASGIEARLLAAGRDEAPPPDLLARTLDAVSAAGAAASGAASAAAGAEAGAAVKAASLTGSLWSAIGIGALAGVATIGGYSLVTRDAPGAPVDAARPAPVIAAPIVSSPISPVNRAPPPPSIEVTEAPAAAPSARPSASPTASGAAISSLASELALIDEARSALRRGDASGARAALDRYTRRNPHGQLAPEAAMLRAEADQALDAGRANP